MTQMEVMGKWRPCTSLPRSSTGSRSRTLWFLARGGLAVALVQVHNNVMSATSLLHACHLCGAQKTPFCLSVAASLLVLGQPHKIRIWEFPSCSGLTRVLLPLSCCVSSGRGSQHLLFSPLPSFTDLQSAAPALLHVLKQPPTAFPLLSLT